MEFAIGLPPTLAPTVETSNTASFVVDRKLDVEVLTVGGASAVAVSPGGPEPLLRYEQAFTVQNQGNADDIYRFDIETVAGDDFDFNTAVDLYHDFDGNGAFTPNVDVLLTTFTPASVDGDLNAGTGTLTYTATLAAPIGLDTVGNAVVDASAAPTVDTPTQTTDATFNLILVTQPTNAAGDDGAVDGNNSDGDLAIYEVTAVSITGADPNADTLTVEDPDGLNDVNLGDEVVFADGEDLATFDGRALTTEEMADDSDLAVFQIAAADFEFNKTTSIICDPINGFVANGNEAYHIPGAYVSYTLTIINNGSTSALLTTLTDNLQGDLRFDTDYITNGDDTDPGSECGPTGGTDVDNTTGGNVKITGPNGVAYYTALAPPAAGIPDPTDLGAIAAATTAGTIGPVIVTPGGVDGGGASFGELITFLATVPTGPLPPDAGPRLQGELQSGETLEIVFNAIVR